MRFQLCTSDRDHGRLEERKEPYGGWMGRDRRGTRGVIIEDGGSTGGVGGDTHRWTRVYVLILACWLLGASAP